MGLIDYFFGTTDYKYRGVVININHHGTVGAGGGDFDETDYMIYHDSLVGLVKFIKQYTDNILLVNLLDFYQKKPRIKWLPRRIQYQLYRWKILKEAKDAFRTNICHRRNIEIEKAAKELNVKFLDLNGVIDKHNFLRVNNIHPEARALGVITDTLIAQIK